MKPPVPLRQRQPGRRAASQERFRAERRARLALLLPKWPKQQKLLNPCPRLHPHRSDRPMYRPSMTVMWSSPTLHQRSECLPA
ncbi:MAG: hypothetical protein EBU75_11755, partial [Betaproteobacteria bacterium]|nr:hypothetical protein [Betaproteobacteria bacterium]